MLYWIVIPDSLAHCEQVSVRSGAFTSERKDHPYQEQSDE